MAFSPENEPGSAADEPASDELEALLKEELAPELEVLRRISRGSMAIVYLAREQQLKRLVAIKVLAPRLARDQRARMRFEREAQSAASLSHPNIVAIYRVGRLSNDLPFIVMQYVQGSTMAERLRARGALPMDEARRVVAEVASAIAAAHKKGIVHRDVRPGNVLYEEESGRALLADFGIAAILATGERSESARLTRTGELVGDPSYMSPEQLLGQEISERSDLYSLGLLGYELVAGRGPFEATSKREKLMAHVQAQPKELSELRATVDPVLESVLLRCLAKEPGHRPSATDVAASLTDMSGELTPMPLAGGKASTGFFARLTERRMPQIIVAYGAICWGVLGVADQLADRDVVPEVFYKLVLVAVLTGLPAVLTGAWFHGQKGRQEFTRVEYWVFGALGVVWLAVSALILFKWRSG